MLSGGVFTLITFMMMKNFDRFYAVSKKHRISVYPNLFFYNYLLDFKKNSPNFSL